VFVGPRSGERITASTVTHAMPRMLEDAGLPRLTPHGLRHGVATMMVARGVHMRAVADQLGHRNPSMTAKVYAHVTPEALKDAVQLLNRRTEVR
jgi:integrase/recombinase XerC